MPNTTFTFFVHLRATKAWLTLKSKERETFTEKAIRKLGAKFRALEDTMRGTVNWYKSQAFRQPAYLLKDK